MWLDAVLEGADHTAKLQRDLQYFCEHALKLRPKAGPLVPFLLTPPSSGCTRSLKNKRRHWARALHRLEGSSVGRVDVCCGEAVSRRTIHNPGLRTIILGHEKRASSNLFQIVKRFHDHLPDSIKPSIGVSNAEELIFDRLDSGYIVASVRRTAPDIPTAQLLHASEAAILGWIAGANGRSCKPCRTLTAPKSSSSRPRMATTTSTVCGEKPRPDSLSFSRYFCLGPLILNTGARSMMTSKWTKQRPSLAELYDLDAEQIAWRRAKVGQLGNADL